MTTSMDVVCLADTGHILAALAATTSGEVPGLAAIVGAELPVASVRSTQNGTEALVPARSLIPADLLELKTVPFDERVIANPLIHAVDGGRVVELPLAAAPPAPTLAAFDITLTGGSIDTMGFAVVAREGDPRDQWRIQSGQFVDADGSGGADDLVLPLTIVPDDTPAGIEDSGRYDILVALEGMRPFWATHTFP